MRTKKYIVIAMLALTPAFLSAQTIQADQYVIWGIGDDQISIPAGSVITEAVLTIQNVAPQNTPLYIHLLDNTDKGLQIGTDAGSGDFFDSYGVVLSGAYENGSYVCRFSQTENAQSPIRVTFPSPTSVTLANSTTVQLSSALLELMDYAGNGRGFGIGIKSVQNATIVFSSLTLKLTVSSYQTQVADQILTFTYTSQSEYALQFDGVDDRVTISDNTHLQSTSGTVSVRIKTSDAGAFYRGIVTKLNGWYLGTVDNKLMLYDMGGRTARSTGVNIADGLWHHVAFSYQAGVANGTVVYIDGTPVLTTTISFHAVNPNTKPVLVGMGYEGQGFAGMLSDVQFYDEVLDAAAIRSLRADEVVGANPVGDWKLNEGAGTVACDSSVNGYNGTIAGAMWTVLQDQALQFDGVDDRVTISDNTHLQSTSGTVSVRIKTSDAGAFYRGIVTKLNGWYLGTVDNKLMLYDMGGRTARSTGVNIADGLWHHVAFSYQAGVANGTVVYIDGTPVLTTTISFHAVNPNTKPVLVGMGYEGQGFAGMLSDVQFYDEVLDAAAIRSLRADEVVGANPVGDWKLNEGAGTVACDSSVNGYNGTIAGAMWTVLQDQALQFDGVDDRVTISDNTYLQSTSGTVSVRIKTSDAGSSYRGIVTKLNGWYLGTVDNKLMLYDMGGRTARSTGVNIADGLWHHVAFSYQAGVANGTVVYIDGTPVLTTTISFHAVNPNTKPVLVGMGYEGQGFAGMLSDVQFYDEVLDAAAIRSLRADEVVGANPVGDWKLNEGAGTVACDSSVNGYNGTINGAVWVTGQ